MRAPIRAARGRHRTVRAALTGAVVVLGLAHAPDVAAAICEAKAPTVNFVFDMPKPKLDNTLSQPELQQLANKFETETHGGRTLGLYSTKIRIPFTMKTKMVTAGDTVCMSVVEIEVRVSLQDRRIYVIKEWKPGTCPYTSILAHEEKHRSVDDTVFRERATIAKRKIADAVVRIGTISVAKSQTNAAQDRLGKLVEESLSKITMDMVEARNQAQRNVDAGLEYSRVAASCQQFRAPS
jgi:hypothetical protein